MRTRTFRRTKFTDSRPARLTAAALVLTATGALTVTFVSSGGKGSAEAATSLSQYVDIEKVALQVAKPAVGQNASVGTFTVDCGTNGNGKFSPDNPVAQPGIKNGAEHVHDFVGNLAITATSTDADLEASGTTCANGDKSSYFWPVVRIDRSVRATGDQVQEALDNTSATIVCPSVGDRLSAVPADAKATVDAQLALLDRLEVAVDRRILATRGVHVQLNNEILQWLRWRRAAVIERITVIVADRGGRQAPGLMSLADCDVSYDGIHASLHGAHTGDTEAAPVANPQVSCPGVRDKLPGVPTSALADVNRNLDELDRQSSVANERLVTTRGQGGPNFVDNAILGPLAARRAAALDRIAIAIGRTAPRPQGLDRFARCTLNPQDGSHQHDAAPAATSPSAPAAVSPSASAAVSPSATPSASPLPDPQGTNLELPNNTGGIVRPASVIIEYRGNAVSKVVPMPKFLRELTGDAKPTSRGPANARATWTCSGFTDRLSDKYPICPQGSQVQRIQDFPGCWDGKNIDSANHRSHVAFADKTTGACPQNFVAIPQLRITISYDIPRDVQVNGQFALDSFPEENHNPFSDHNDFINVNSVHTMQGIATCINDGRNCE